MFDTISNIRFKYLFRNLCYLFTRDLTADMQQSELRLDALYQKIVHLPMPLARDYQDEIAYLKQAGWATFPYPLIRSLPGVTSGRETGSGLPFVVHQGKRLFFPRTWSRQRVETVYRGYIETEGIVGEGYRSKTPHRYQTDDFQVRTGDVVVDIGAAEGLFALDVIDKAKRVYLFECDPVWRKPLQATFAPYAAKVSIINKAVGERDTRRVVRMATCLRDELNEPLFIKMDIEGAEVPVVEASRAWLSEATQLRLCCCTYHRLHDAERLKSLLDDMGYHTAFSEGFMLYSKDRIQQKPYFRHGLIRAHKIPAQASAMLTGIDGQERQG